MKMHHLKRSFHKILAGLLVLALSAGLLAGCGAKKTSYKREENTDKHAATYPYVVRTPSAEVYLAKADIELLGEEEFYAGLDRILLYLEDDLQDAKNALKRYIHKEVPVIKIYTDFSGRTENGRREEIGGYYNESTVDIHVFHNWTQAEVVLLHEYTHFLTMHCCGFELDGYFWSEGIADYISKIRCKNRMAVDVGYGLPEASLKEIMERGAATEDGKLDLRKCYYGTAAIYRSEIALGAPYLAVSQAATTLSETQLRAPLMNEVSYYEAACILEYLVDYYGEEKVFSHLNITGKQMQEIYGKTFIEICEEWVADNLRKCKELGIRIDGLT